MQSKANYDARFGWSTEICRTKPPAGPKGSPANDAQPASARDCGIPSMKFDDGQVRFFRHLDGSRVERDERVIPLNRLLLRANRTAYPERDIHCGELVFHKLQDRVPDAWRDDAHSGHIYIKLDNRAASYCINSNQKFASAAYSYTTERRETWDEWSRIEVEYRRDQRRKRADRFSPCQKTSVITLGLDETAGAGSDTNGLT